MTNDRKRYRHINIFARKAPALAFAAWINAGIRAVGQNYLTVSEMANRIQDRLLVALAVTISEHAINSRGDLLSRDIELLLEQFTRENTYYRVQGPDGAFVTGILVCRDCPLALLWNRVSPFL